MNPYPTLSFTVEFVTRRVATPLATLKELMPNPLLETRAWSSVSTVVWLAVNVEREIPELFPTATKSTAETTPSPVVPSRTVSGEAFFSARQRTNAAGLPKKNAMFDVLLTVVSTTVAYDVPAPNAAMPSNPPLMMQLSIDNAPNVSALIPKAEPEIVMLRLRILTASDDPAATSMPSVADAVRAACTPGAPNTLTALLM